MAGVRIRADDPALANKLVEIEHAGRRTPRGPKRYQLRLDDTGAAIVSPVVWERLREAMALLPACPRFHIVDHVYRPPTLTIGGRPDEADVVRYAAGHVQAVGQLLVPRITAR